MLSTQDANTVHTIYVCHYVSLCKIHLRSVIALSMQEQAMVITTPQQTLGALCGAMNQVNRPDDRLVILLRCSLLMITLIGEPCTVHMAWVSFMQIVSSDGCGLDCYGGCHSSSLANDAWGFGKAPWPLENARRETSAPIH